MQKIVLPILLVIYVRFAISYNDLEMPESDLEGVQGLSNDDSVGLVQDNDAGILKTTMKSNTGSKVANNVSLAQTQNSQPIDCKRVSSDLMDTDPDYCCFGPTVFSQETLFNCQINNRNRADWFYDDPSDNECVVQCMFENKNMTTNNVIDKVLLVNETLRTRSFDRNVWEPIVTRSVDECMKSERLVVNASGPIICDPKPYIVLHCLYVQLLKKCPVDNLNTDPKCKILSNYVNTCDSIPKHQTYSFN